MILLLVCSGLYLDSGSVPSAEPIGDGSGVVGRPHVGTFQSAANKALLIAICLTT
jgi:hypothetical protein